jgi:hypothetical protein
MVLIIGKYGNDIATVEREFKENSDIMKHLLIT